MQGDVLALTKMVVLFKMYNKSCGSNDTDKLNVCNVSAIVWAKNKYISLFAYLSNL